MSSVVRSVLGAAFLLTGASTAMAQYASTAPAPNPSVQTGASQPVSSNNAPLVEPSRTARDPRIADKSDTHGGFDPKSKVGARAFWDDQSNQY